MRRCADSGKQRYNFERDALMWEQRIETIMTAKKNKIVGNKISKTAKKKKLTKGDKPINDFGFDHAKLFDEIKSLQAGNISDTFTLLPIAKASSNHTVEKIVDVDDELALCVYKTALDNVKQG